MPVPLRPVTSEVVTVSRGAVERTLDSSGKVVANRGVDIKCRASGQIVKLPFDVRQQVKRGDLLCQLDPAGEQLAIRSTEAVVAPSSGKLAQAKLEVVEAQQSLATTRRRNATTVFTIGGRG